MDRIAILIPCYNEEKTIGKVIADFKKALPEAVIYVYDNNSTDNTDNIAKNAGATVRYERRQGKGNVIRSMFREIDADCYIMVDGDDTYPPESASRIADEVLIGGADMVIGDRLSSTYYIENKRRFHNLGNKFTKAAINLLFKSDMQDIMTGFRGFSYQFVKSFPILSKGFEIETEMSIHAVDKNMLISNVIVDYRDRPLGSESKLNTVTDGVKVLSTIAILFKNYRPLAFFSAIAVLLALIGVILFIPILITYLKTHVVPRFPTFILCVFLWLAAIQSFFGGLMLNVIKQKSLHDFEILLHEIYFRKRQLKDESYKDYK